MYGTRDYSLDITMPAPFAALADVKSFLSITDTLSDTTLTSFLNASPLIIEKFCNRVIAQRTVTETMFLDDGAVNNLVLAMDPVIALESITLTSDGASVADSPSNYIVMNRAGTLRRVDGTPITAQQIQVVYTAGYATVPGPIFQATLELVRLQNDARNMPGGVASENVEGVGSVTYSASAATYITGPTGTKLPPEVAMFLSPYVRRFAPA